MRPDILDALAWACLVIAGAFFLAAFFGLIEGAISTIFDRSKHKP